MNTQCVRKNIFVSIKNILIKNNISRSVKDIMSVKIPKYSLLLSFEMRQLNLSIKFLVVL